MSPFLAELIGTAILIIFGNGVVSNVVLSRTKGNGGGWIVIAAGWGMAVFVAVFCVSKYSGAHLNPAVSLGMAAAGRIGVGTMFSFITAQMIGGILGAAVVWVFSPQHFQATNHPHPKPPCFFTTPITR